MLFEDESAETNFAVRDLAEVAGRCAGVQIDKHDAPQLLFFRADSKQGASLLKSLHLQFDPAMNDEGYVIVPAGVRSVFVIAKSDAGFFYGSQTVKQLVRGSGKDMVLLVPTLRDWPAWPIAVSPTIGRAVRFPTWTSQARNPHPGGVQIQHFLALLRAHLCLCKLAHSGLSRRGHDSRRSA